MVDYDPPEQTFNGINYNNEFFYGDLEGNYLTILDADKLYLKKTGGSITRSLNIAGNLDIIGYLNSSSLYQNGTLIDFSSYATITALATIICC